MSSIPFPGREELVKEKGQLKEFLRNKPNMLCDKDNKQIILKISYFRYLSFREKDEILAENREIHLLCCIMVGLNVISVKHRNEQRFARFRCDSFC